MVKIIIYSAGILLIVALGFYFELNSGDSFYVKYPKGSTQNYGSASSDRGPASYPQK